MAAGSTAAHPARQAPAREPCLVSHGRARPKPWPASPANVSKRGLSARLYAPNQTLIMVKARLPKRISPGRTRVTGAGAVGQLVRGIRSRVQAGTGSGQLVRRAGTPTAVHPLGTSHVTTDPAPILAKSPILMSPIIVAPVLSRTPLPILGARSGVSTFRPMVTFCITVTSSPMVTKGPTTTPVA